MVSTDTAIDALSAALALARAEGREVHSMRDLLCVACGEGAALRAGGLCCRCGDEMSAHYDARREADRDAYDCAMHDDPEAVAMLAGLNPGKM